MTRFLFSAWGVSLGLHLAAIVLLAGSLDLSRHGTGEGQGDSLSIVLNHSGKSDAERQGDSSNGEQSDQLQVLPEPPPLLEVVTNRAPTASLENSRVVQASATVDATNHATTLNRTQTNVRSAATASPRSGSALGNGQATVSVFGVEGRGNKFLYLFDRSASMEGSQLTAAKRQLLESMRSLTNTNQFRIVFFNTTTQSFDGGGPRRNVFATDQNKQLAANFVGGITADGGTDRMVALQTAVGSAPDVIFFLTDADDPMSERELFEIERMTERIRATICVIEFGYDPEPVPDNFLMRLARDTGGRYGYVNTTTLRR
jgi:hypothetical protein